MIYVGLDTGEIRGANVTYLSYNLMRRRGGGRNFILRRGVAGVNFNAAVARQRIPSMYNTAPGIVPAFIPYTLSENYT